MKKMIVMILFAAASVGAVMIPARSISVSTNGMSTTTNTTVQTVLVDFDSILEWLLAYGTNLQLQINAESNLWRAADATLLPKTNGVADTLAVTNSITLNGVTITAWKDPSEGMSQVEGDVRYIQLSAMTNDVIDSETNVPTAKAVYDAMETKAAITSLTTVEESVTELAVPNQQFTGIITNVLGTATVTYASGSLVQFTATNNTVITFDNTEFPISGVSRVDLEVFAGTNTITFPTNTIANTTITFSTNNWTSIFFRQVQGGLWTGRQ